MSHTQLQDIKDETNNLAIDAYLKLRNLDGESLKIQQLEEILSNTIHSAEESIQKMRSHKLVDYENEFYRRRTILKRIADGLAWNIFNFDSHAIHGCSIGRPAGFMAGKEGYFEERKLIRDLYSISEIQAVIQSDITNILHWGDLIAISKNGKVISVEIKGDSSSHDRRAHRQKKRYKDIASFLKYGQQKSVTVDRDSLRTININQIYKNYWDQLDDMIPLTLESGFSWKLFDECVYLGVVNNEVNQHEKIFRESIRKCNWKDPYLKLSSLGRHFEKNLKIIPPTCLPLTVFQINPAHGIYFLLGKIDAIVLININEIIRQLNNVGIKARLNEEKKVEVDNGVTNYIISDGAWSKLLYELLTVPSFLEFIIKSNKFINDTHLFQ